jgi:hypothetical protein
MADWPMFGFDAARENVGPANSGIEPTSLGHLVRQQVKLPGTVDSSPIYLHGVVVKGRRHDAFFVTTTYGITLAIDATTGHILWRYQPASYGSLAGSAQITTMTPVADPGRAAIYAGW